MLKQAPVFSKFGQIPVQINIKTEVHSDTVYLRGGHHVIRDICGSCALSGDYFAGFLIKRKTALQCEILVKKRLAALVFGNLIFLKPAAFSRDFLSRKLLSFEEEMD